MDGEELNIYTNNVHVAFVALCHYNMYYCTDASRPEKKDQLSVKKEITFTKFSTKLLNFISIGSISYFLHRQLT